MRYMGIDQSYTSTGIVIMDDFTMIHHDLIHTDKEEDIFSRARFIAKRIGEISDAWEVDEIAIEGLGFSATGNATRDLGGLQFVIVSHLRYHRYPAINPTIVAPTTLKKHACHGKAKKDEMFEALPDDVRDVFGKYPKTKGRFDLSDAYWLAHFIVPAIIIGAS